MSPKHCTTLQTKSLNTEAATLKPCSMPWPSSKECAFGVLDVGVLGFKVEGLVFRAFRVKGR